MRIDELLTDAFGRVRDVVHDAVEDLTDEQLASRPTADANSIAWLVWHLTRIQDDHMSALFAVEQRWVQVWSERFGLPFPIGATGYGHSPVEVAAVHPSRDLLIGYHDDVHAHTVSHLPNVNETTLDRIVDRGWDPPVTEGVRIVSVISDCLQHAGQAAYCRGLLATRERS